MTDNVYSFFFLLTSESSYFDDHIIHTNIDKTKKLNTNFQTFPALTNCLSYFELQEKSPDDVESTFKKLYDRYVNDKSVEKSSSGSSNNSGNK